MFFQRIFTSGLAINSYLIGDEKTKRCVVIDPTRNVVPYIMQAQNAGLDITDILETHVHADFVSGAKELKHQLNGKPRIYASGMGGSQSVPAYADQIVQHGFQLKIGDVRLEAIHTPGHTFEHVAWLCYDDSRSSKTPWFAFTGDCVFVGSVGRPDLLGENEVSALSSQSYHTLFDTLATLPDFVEILPGHGEGSSCGKSLKARPSSTFGYERLFNPYFKKESRDVWTKNLLKGLAPPPPYFQRVKKINLQGPSLLSSLKTLKWHEEKEAPELNKLFLMDIRHPESFASSHIQGSLNIPFSSSFCQWAGWMLPDKLPIGLIAESTCLYCEAVDQLRLMGFDQEIWVILLGKEKEKMESSLSSFKVMDAEEVAKQQLYILDVRTPEEWQSGHIPEAHHVELIHLETVCQQLPHDQSIALVCRSGIRASLAASLLKKHGFPLVINIRGGMQAWKQAGLPMMLENGKKC